MTNQPEKDGMDRRKALKNLSLVFGAASSVPALAGLSAEAVFAQGQSIHLHLPAQPAKLSVPELSRCSMPTRTRPSQRSAN